MLKPIATLVERQLTWFVDVTWTGCPLDRASTGGWLFDLDQKSLAQRLVKCINADKAYKPNVEIKTDVNGKTYVSAETTEFFHKRHMNVSLKKLGF